MFKRINLEAWHEFLPFVGLAVAILVFACGVIYALRLRRSEVERLAALPLDIEEEDGLPPDETRS